MGGIVMDTDRIKSGFVAILRGILSKVDYLALYGATVVSQAADGTLELLPDDERVPGAAKVPIRHGLAGVHVKVPAGARVLMGFENGNASKPFAALWELAAFTELGLGSESHGQATEKALLGTTYRQREDTLLTALQSAHSANAAAMTAMATAFELLAANGALAAEAAACTAAGLAAGAAASPASSAAGAVTTFQGFAAQFLSSKVRVR
jgi:hypothetical protein